MADREVVGNPEEEEVGEEEQQGGEKEGEEEEDPLVIDEEKPAEAAPEDVNEAEEDENEKEFEPTVSFFGRHILNGAAFHIIQHYRKEKINIKIFIGGHDHE